MDKEKKGKEIREARERLGLTQRNVAWKIGVCQGTVWQWEMGYHFPAKRRVEIAEKVLGIELQKQKKP